MPPTLRVHVVPVGDDVIERIWMPLKVEEADKVYLLTVKGVDAYAPNYDAAKKKILDEQIVKPERLIEVREDFYDFSALMCRFAEICRDEQERAHNKVYFNVSTGGKLVAHAEMLACLVFDATPYYCKQGHPKKDITYPPTILNFPHYPVERPEPDVIQFLVKVRNFLNKTKRTWVSKKECLAFAPALEKDKESTRYKKMRYMFFDKLAKWHFADIEKNPRGKVRLTQEGHLAAQIFAAYYVF